MRILENTGKYRKWKNRKTIHDYIFRDYADIMDKVSCYFVHFQTSKGEGENAARGGCAVWPGVGSRGNISPIQFLEIKVYISYYIN